MNSGQRIGLLVGAVVILVVAFVVFQGGSDNDDGGESGDGAAQVTTTSTGTGGAQAPSDQDSVSGGTATDENREDAAPVAPAPKSVKIEGGQPAGGVKTLKYQSGDTVRIRFSSDQAGEVHIHGYDKELEVEAGKPQTVTFKANLEGVFEIEDHHSGALLAKLEVRP